MAPNLPTDEQLVTYCKKSCVGGARVVRISDEAIIKFGIDVTQAEATNQLHVWKYTNPSIFRVPEPYRFFQDDSQGSALAIGYLVMEFIEGTELSAYLARATSLEEQTVFEHINAGLEHLATVPLPNGQGPGPVGGGPLRGYLWSDSGVYSSFASASEMGRWMNKLLSEFGTGFGQGLFDFSSVKLVMCHTDLAPRNILRLDDGRLAFLDWGSAGFYPKTFEAYALRTRVDREPILAKILLELPREAKDEKQIQGLSRIESILLRYSDAVNLRFRCNTDGYSSNSIQKSARPAVAPTAGGLNGTYYVLGEVSSGTGSSSKQQEVEFL